LITDLVGSTALESRLGPSQADELRREHFGVLREAIEGADGREVKNTGDGLMVSFASASSAVRCAVRIQQMMERRNRVGAQPLQVRVGVGAGEASVEGDDYFGMPSIEAARLCDKANGDGILVSSLARMMAARQQELTFESVGMLELKGIPEPVEAFSVAWEPLAYSRADALEDAARARETSDGLLLERERETEALNSTLAAAESGSGGLALIDGPAGIGKTRLLAAAAERAMASGMTVLRARGAELERDYSWGVVRQLFERWLLDRPAAERARLLTGPAEPALAALGLAPSEEDRETFVAIHGLFWLAVNAAEESPIVLVVDDAQWSDEASLHWLTYLAARLDGLPAALLVAVRRPDPAADRETLQRLALEPIARTLNPAPLSVQATEALVAARRTLAGAPELADACQEATGGNPFLLGALLDDLSELAVERAPDPDSVRALRPEEITRSVLLRLGQLSEEARLLARAFAVLGGSTTMSRAATLADVGLDQATAAASDLATVGVLADAAPPAFAHPVVHSVVLHDMPPHERAAWHARAADVLRRSEGGLQEVAAQLLQVEPSADPETVETLCEAARVALNEGAAEAAAALLERAVREPPSTSARASVQRLLGRAQIRAHGAAGLEALRAAVEAAEEPAERAETALELARALEGLSRNVEATAVYDQALSRLPAPEGPLARTLEAGLAVAAAQHLSTLPRALEVMAAALGRDPGEEDDPTGANDVIKAVLATGAAAAGASEGVAMAEAALRGEGLFEADTSIAIGLALTALAWGDRLDAALAGWDEVIARAHRRGAPLRFAFAATFRADVHLRAGRLADAEADARAALDVPEEMWPGAVPVDTPALLADALTERGELSEADALLAPAGRAEALSDYQGNNLLLMARGRLRLAQGRPDDAAEDLLELGRRCEAWTLRNPAAIPWRSHASLALRDRDRSRAIELADEEVELARGFGAARALGIGLRAAGLARGNEEGLDRLREAVDVLSSSPARLELARALVDLGAAERRASRRVDARARLAEGLDAAAACGARPLTERARTELSAAGARPRRDRITGRDALTASELRVARMAAEGKTNREIAQAQWVTLSTVETHLTHVYSKLDIANRKQLPAALERDAAGAKSSG
jgi:class 3 adenylate cyclase/DNA-binding CsgD family transcriptional regulator